MDEPTKRDRVRGMFAGLILGDALGAPHEFYKWNRNTIYTGKLEIQPYRQKDARYNKPEERDLYQPIGSVTDDTQMTIALMKCITNDQGKYIRDNVILCYADWTHSGPSDIGKNTRFLFTNKTVKGYEARVKKRDKEIKEGTMAESLSNGALMRCTPIALLANWSGAMIEDVNLTNPYDDTRDVNLVYLNVLLSLLHNGSIDDTMNIIDTIRESLHQQVKVAIKDAVESILRLDNNESNDDDRDISGKDKGLSVHALYCALRGLWMISLGYTYPEIIDWVITQNTETGKGDTDTNAAITGALLGAYFGFDLLMNDETTADNWDILIKAAKEIKDPLAKYVPQEFDTMVNDYLKSITISEKELFKKEGEKLKQFQVGDVIVFNEDAYMHRTSMVFGRITMIKSKPQGEIVFVELPRIKSSEYIDPAYSTCTVNPDLKADTSNIYSSYLTPKRGKGAGFGYYRFASKDVYVMHYDPNQTYKDEACY